MSDTRPLDFAGSVATVTGAGTGIGRACAIKLADRGATVVLVGRRSELLAEVASTIEGAGGHALAHRADLTDEGQVRELIEHTLDAFGRLDVAVNAVGAVSVGPLVEADQDSYDAVMDANVKATWLAMKYQIPAMARAGGGAIVNVASRAALVGTENGGLYSGAKHAVLGLTRTAALEAAAQNVRVNAVCPGPTRTDQFDRIVALAMPGTAPSDAAALLGRKVPLGRIAEPEEIAQAIVWLASPAAGFVTGTALPVDGGGGAG